MFLASLRVSELMRSSCGPLGGRGGTSDEEADDLGVELN